MAEPVWYVRDKGRVMGPFTQVQFDKLRSAGRVNRLSEVSNDGSSWSSAANVVDGTARSGNATAQVKGGSAASGTNAPSQAGWFYASGGERIGPVRLSDLTPMFTNGNLDADTPVWNETMADWKPAKQVAELLGYIPLNHGRESTSDGNFINAENGQGLSVRRARGRKYRVGLFDLNFRRFHMGWIVPTLWIVNLVTLFFFLLFMLGTAFFPRAIDGLYRDFAESLESMSFESRRLFGSFILIAFSVYLVLNARVRLENFYLQLITARKIKALDEYDEVVD